MAYALAGAIVRNALNLGLATITINHGLVGNIIFTYVLAGAIVRNALYLGLAGNIIWCGMYLGLIMTIFHWLVVDLIRLALNLCWTFIINHGLVGNINFTCVRVGDISLTPVPVGDITLPYVLLAVMIRTALDLG